MMDDKELRITAELAHLDLTDRELTALKTEVGQMLEYFELMNQVDVSGLEPTTHALLKKNRLRSDVPAEQLCSTEELLRAAPEEDENFFLVPNVLSHVK